MRNIDFSMTYLALKMFGKQLYANMSAAIAELVANGLDANAEEVYVHMDIRDKSNATIAIYDNGDGMDDKILESDYATIGRNKRNKLSPEEAAKIMGRKGIGKLAALYLSNTYYIITKRKEMSMPRVWKLDVSNIKDDDLTPQLIEVSYPLEDDMVFASMLENSQKGTIILLKNVKIKNFGEAAELALEQKLANYFLTSNLSQKIKLCVLKTNGQEIRYDEVEKDIAFKNLAVIYTTDTERFNDLCDNVVTFKDKRLQTKDQLYTTKREVSLIPDQVEATVKNSSGISEKVINPISGSINIDGKDYQYNLEGWIGIHATIEQEEARINAPNFKKNMHYNPNQLRIYVRNKLATSEFLSYLGMTAAFLNYIEGEISFDILDVEELEDIATAGRDNFSIQDERVKKLIELCKGLASKLVNKRQHIADEMSEYRSQIEEQIKEQERQEIKNRFRKGAIKSKKVFDNMPKEDQEAVEDDFVQFSRAANLSQPTKKILISHKKDCENFGNFVIDILIKVEPSLKNSIIFTSNSDYGVPQGYDICSYLNECLGIAKCEINPFAIPGLYIPIHFGKESQAVTDFIIFKPFFGHPNMVFFSVEAHSVIIHATDKDPFETNRPICDFFNLTIKFKWYVVIAESETAACLFLALASNKLKIQILVIGEFITANQVFLFVGIKVNDATDHLKAGFCSIVGFLHVLPLVPAFKVVAVFQVNHISYLQIKSTAKRQSDILLGGYNNIIIAYFFLFYNGVYEKNNLYRR